MICTDVAARGIDIHGVPYGEKKLLLYTLTSQTMAAANHCLYLQLSMSPCLMRSRITCIGLAEWGELKGTAPVLPPLSSCVSELKSNTGFEILQDGPSHFPGGNRKRKGNLSNVLFQSL